jgi:hypothetical protein
MGRKKEGSRCGNAGREIARLSARERTRAGMVLGDWMPDLDARARRMARRLGRPDREDDIRSDLCLAVLRSVVSLLRTGRDPLVWKHRIIRLASQYSWRNIVLKVERAGGRLSGRGPIGTVRPHRAGVEQSQWEQEGWLWRNATYASASPVPFAVGFRLDFPSWLASLVAHQRKAALALAAGESGWRAAQLGGFSPTRMSQLRKLWAAELSERLLP